MQEHAPITITIPDKTIIDHNKALKRAGLPKLETLAARIIRVYNRATEAERDAGANWYAHAHHVALSLSDISGVGLHAAAAVISHLSPRTSWRRNVEGATALLARSERSTGIIGRNYNNAVDCVDHPNPLDTFSGKKTQRFFVNITGNWDVVTVDVWAARVAGVTEKQLQRVGVYEAVEAAYRRAARIKGVEPAVMQATTWIVARNGRVA